MYNSLPQEEDITRVYVLRPVGISNPEGILLFPLKKRKEKESDLVQRGCNRHFCVYRCMRALWPNRERV